MLDYISKCMVCGKEEHPDLLIMDGYGGPVKCRKCLEDRLKKSIQPERSKREDFCDELSHDWCHIPLSDFVDCRRCGALNTMET